MTTEEFEFLAAINTNLQKQIMGLEKRIDKLEDKITNLYSVVSDILGVEP